MRTAVGRGGTLVNRIESGTVHTGKQQSTSACRGFKRMPPPERQKTSIEDLQG